MRSIIIILFTLLVNGLCAQKEASIWYFGWGAGLNFRTGSPPTALTDNKLKTFHGCASICDFMGKLLFYTDGETVIDNSQSIMQNGTGLLGTTAPTQAAIIIPKPGAPDIYYIFTVDGEGKSAKAIYGLNYSEVDMTMNGGLGAITTNKNIQLAPYIGEKLTAVKQSNGKGYWVLVVKPQSDSLLAYSVTGSGVNPKPVVSRINTKFRYLFGCMKFSPNGRLLAIANAYDSVLVCNFDPHNGKVSHWFSLGPSIKEAYGVEFSPSGKFLYVGNKRGNNILQFSLLSAKPADILKTKYIVADHFADTMNLGIGTLQMGPDKKMYCAQGNVYYIHAIEYPDSAGTSCSYKKDYVSLVNKYCEFGLPNYIQSFFETQTIVTTNSCARDTTRFQLNNFTYMDSVLWAFGDPSTGKDNRSTEFYNTKHYYANPGNYTIQVLVYYSSHIDTVIRKVYISDSKPHLGNDSLFCKKPILLLIKPNKNFISYSWNTGKSTKSILANLPGEYILKTLDSSGCRESDTISIQLVTIEPELGGDSIYCARSAIKLQDRAKITFDTWASSTFYFTDSVTINDSFTNRIVPPQNSLGVKLVTLSSAGCKDSISKILLIHPTPVTRVTVPADSICYSMLGFKVDNKSSIISGTLLSKWQFGILAPDTNYIPSTKFFPNKTVRHLVNYIAISDNGCADTFSTYVQVFETPAAKISVNDSVQCYSNSFVLQNISQYSVPDSLTSLWSMGNGHIIDSIAGVIYAYGADGVYTVKLRTRTVQGCTDSASIKLQVLAPLVAIFSVNSDSQCLKNNIFHFQNDTTNHSNGMKYKWSFGDGTLFSGTHPQHKYLFPGEYQVYLSIQDPENCHDSTNTQVIVMREPQAEFTIDKPKQCLANNSLNLTNSTVSGGEKLNFQWDFDDSTNANSNDIIKKSFKYPGIHKIKLKAVSSIGCADSILHSVNILIPPRAAFIHDNLCDSQTVFFYNNSLDISAPITNVSWHLIGEPVRTGDTVNYHFGSPRTISLEMRVTDSFGCMDSTSKSLTIEETPSPTISYEAYQILTGNEVIYKFDGLPGGMNSYQWTFDQAGTMLGKQVLPKFQFSADSLNATLKVTSSAGCVGYSSVTFYLMGLSGFYFPNTISANGDGLNDGFGISGPELIRTCKLMIYNRWGERVFESTNPYDRWFPKKEMQEIYIYKFECKDIYNRFNEQRGVLRVIK